MGSCCKVCFQLCEKIPYCFLWWLCELTLLLALLKCFIHSILLLTIAVFSLFKISLLLSVQWCIFLVQMAISPLNIAVVTILFTCWFLVTCMVYFRNVYLYLWIIFNIFLLRFCRASYILDISIISDAYIVSHSIDCWCTISFTMQTLCRFIYFSFISCVSDS